MGFRLGRTQPSARGQRALAAVALPCGWCLGIGLAYGINQTRVHGLPVILPHLVVFPLLLVRLLPTLLLSLALSTGLLRLLRPVGVAFSYRRWIHTAGACALLLCLTRAPPVLWRAEDLTGARGLSVRSHGTHTMAVWDGRPPELGVKLWNNAGESLMVGEPQKGGLELEVDGCRYRPCVDLSSGWGKPLAGLFASQGVAKGFRVRLVADDWRAIDTDEPLDLQPGRHDVRVALWSSPVSGKWPSVAKSVSNTVHVSLEPALPGHTYGRGPGLAIGSAFAAEALDAGERTPAAERSTCTQTFRVVESLAGGPAAGTEVTVSYEWFDNPSRRERAVRTGERVIWFVRRGEADGWAGIRATTDTPGDPENVERAVADRERWGDRPDGLQIRIETGRSEWFVGEGTRALRTYVRNTGRTEVTLIRDPPYRFLELEVDGEWFRSTTPARDPEQTVSPGFYGEKWPIFLGKGWQEWRTREGKLLEPLLPGKHVVRARCRTTGQDRTPATVYSNELAVAVVTAEEFRPSSDGLTAALRFGGDAEKGGTQPGEEAVFTIGDSFPLVVTVRNETDTPWSLPLHPLHHNPRTYRVADLATGKLLQSIQPGGHYGGHVKRTRIEPHGEESREVADLMALYPHVESIEGLGSLWSPGASYSVRVVIPSLVTVDGGGPGVWPDAVESNILRFRVTGMEKEGVSRFLDAAGTGPVDSRLRAIRALGAAEATDAVPRLTALVLQDESYAIRRQALLALRRIVPTGPDVQVLEQLARADPDPRGRKLAAHFLGERGKQSLRLLKKISRKDADVSVRRAAGKTIERIKSVRERGGR